MAVEVIGTIKPKNNGNFPVVEAKDVSVDSTGKTLDTKLEEIAESVGSGGNVDLSAYQTKTDNTLNTANKTIVGAINEVNAKNVDLSGYLDIGTAANTYLTKEEFDNAQVGGEVDLTAYAKQTEVDDHEERIANLEAMGGPSVNIEDYYTKAETEEKFTKTADLLSGAVAVQRAVADENGDAIHEVYAYNSDLTKLRGDVRTTYATKSALSELDSLFTSFEVYAHNKFDEYGNTFEDHNDTLNNHETRIAEIEGSSNGLTYDNTVILNGAIELSVTETELMQVYVNNLYAVVIEDGQGDLQTHLVFIPKSVTAKDNKTTVGLLSCANGGWVELTASPIGATIVRVSAAAVSVKAKIICILKLTK